MKKIFNSRRNFLLNSGKAAVALGLSQTILPSFTKIIHPENQNNYFTQKPLLYSYDSLQNSIDALTMEIHYTKHAAGYCKNLNEAYVAEVKEKNISLEKVLNNISAYSTKMRNNAGGHYNHEYRFRFFRKF
jgi:superoxide dismutase, Fe-Mn family